MGYGKYINTTDYVGNIYESQSCGKFRVVRELIPIGYHEKSRLFEIEFLDTGYHTIVTRGSIYNGKIKDRLIPTINNVAYIGQEDLFSLDYTEKCIYKVWEGIIARCYNKNDHNYQKYGAIGVKVSDRWLSYRNFENDVKIKPNYERKLLEPTMFHLDKDFLQRHIPINQRVYSNETCIWVSMYENALMKGLDNGRIKYFGVLLDSGYYYTKIYHKLYGRFESPNDAAMLFNYIYPLVGYKEYMTMNIYNEVPMVSFNELMSRNLIINRKDLNPVLEYFSTNNLYQ